jgi:hypothetical protein
MEIVSRSRTQHLIAAIVAALFVAPGVALAAPELDVIGTWHVLVHYKDDNATHPERERWEDRVWVIEKTGSRLRWSDYPIVVFDDQAGRFDRTGGHQSRVLHFWEPNESQLADIQNGLAVNDRGSKSKTLRSKDGNWASFSRNSAASASVISYVEYWSIDDAEPGPVFKREDVLGAERSENLDGVTRYTTESVEAGGDILRGSYVRDGTRRGTFRLMRAGGVEGLKTNGKTPNEKANERGRKALEALGYQE